MTRPTDTADWRAVQANRDEPYEGPECEVCEAATADLAPCVPGDANSVTACPACRAEWLATMRFSEALGEWIPRPHAIR